MSLLSTTRDLPAFNKLFTKLFDDLNLIEMLYDYYYNQWTACIKNLGNLNTNFDIIRNSSFTSDQDFRQVKELEKDKYYLCYSNKGFRFVKKIAPGFKFYDLKYNDSYSLEFDVYDIKADNILCLYHCRYYEIPDDFYPAVAEKLKSLDNSRCILL